MIKAEIVADSLSPQGDRLTSLLITFPRIILAEINTHRMLSKNTASSRAIPFKKMVEAVQENPFIPIAWQKHHSGMQGSEYITDSMDIQRAEHRWLIARDNAIEQAKVLNEGVGVTKQLCNRLLEPFMWTTMLITGSKEGWDNFFELRCPQYEFKEGEPIFKSWEELVNHYGNQTRDFWTELSLSEYTTLEKLKHNKGQAEIHMLTLAECIYDVMNESTPKQLKAGEYHIPFEYTIDLSHSSFDKFKYEERGLTENEMNLLKVKVSTSLAARTSYTVVGDEKEIDYSKMIELHDRLINQNPPHSSPMEHCARAMTDDEHSSFYRGELTSGDIYRANKCISSVPNSGWCRNYKGFIQYRHIVESENNNHL